MNKIIIEEYSKYQEPFLLGRVTTVHKTHYDVECGKSVYICKVSGRFSYTAYQKSDYPVVGDYVVLKPSEYDNKGLIEKVCTRYSKVKRLDVSTVGEEHLLATNVDIIFVCMSLNEDFRLNKLQNFLSITYSSNAEAIILLTKSDICDDVKFYTEEARKLDESIRIIVTSESDKENIGLINEVLANKTGVFIGSSGVGKSTIVNRLLGYEHLNTRDVRSTDDQGRHTTSHRELIHLPNGGAIIDTPGIRIVQSYFVDDLEDSFKQVAGIASNCKFNDCKHDDEPGCMVKQALDDNELSYEVYESYLKTVKLNRFNKNRELIRKRMQDKRKRG